MRTPSIYLPVDHRVQQWPGQVVLAVTQNFWTINVHKAITAGADAMAAYLQECTNDINKIVELVRGKLSKQTR